MDIKRSLFPFLIFLFISLPLAAQNRGAVSGVVTDIVSGKPLTGVNISVDQTLLGVSSDLDGEFSLSLKPGKYTLRISMIGYQPMRHETEVRSGMNTRLNIELTESAVVMDPLIVTAGKHPQALGNSPQAVNMVISEEMIQRQSRSPVEGLQIVPGIHFNEENISIRGSSGYSVYTVGSRVLLMIDGIPVLTADMGTINWDLLPLLDIDRIEVVKGAGSALYGSSAMGGVVNILTREPAPGGRLRVRISGGLYDAPHYEDWHWTDNILHYEQADISYGRQIGPVGFRLAFSRHLSTGYMQNDSLSRCNATGRLKIKMPLNSTLDIYAGWMRTKQDFFIQWVNQNRPFEVPESNLQDELQQQAWNLYLRYAIPLTSNFGLKFRLSHLWFDLESQFTIGDPTGFKPGQGLGSELQADWILHPLHHLIFGAEFKRDISGSRYFGDHEGYTISPYIQKEWTLLPDLRSTLGVRLDHHVLLNEETNTQLSPKLGFNYSPGPATTIRTTFGTGFRAATVFEKYVEADYAGFNILPNPELKSERSWFADLGFSRFIGNGISIEYSGYYSEFFNLIEPVINFTGSIQFENFIKARIWGQELGLKTWWWMRRIGFAASVAYTNARDMERDEPLAYRPEWVYVLTGTLQYGPMLLQGEYRYASRIEKVQLYPLDQRVPVKLLNLRAQLKLWDITVQLAVNNALNYHYVQVERRMAEVRSISLGLLLDTGL